MRVLSAVLSIWCCLAATSAGAAEKLDFGTYHALVIGINDYAHLHKLETAVNGAKAVHELLQRRYGFQSTLLLNADRDTLVRALDRLRETLTESDNLLIYYAGHGYLDRQTDEGFWLPANAEESSQVEWVPVSTVTRMLRATTAKHALIIADSCYSGTLTRDAGVALATGGERMAELARLSAKRARKALTSGGLEPVNDSGGDGQSVFTRALLSALKTNREVIDGDALFRAVRRDVILNAKQTPEYSDVRFAGDEGGDFLFVPVGAVIQPARPGMDSGERFLTGDAIEAAIVGKTLRFKSPRRDGMVRLYFHPGGKVEMAAESEPQRVGEKLWWVANGKALCRTYDRDDKKVCMKLSTGTGGILKLYKGDGSYLFDAEVLEGRHLAP